jgi:tRNA G26 N,N-dimethylase Trm1
MAQNISGKVVDCYNNPLPYVSVVIQSKQDSSYICGTATDSEGLFTLQIQEDTEYTLLVSYMGYETVKKECKA